MTYSQSRGFNAAAIFGWLRSEVAENYRPARSAVLMSDPWWSMDYDYRSAWAGAPGVSW